MTPVERRQEARVRWRRDLILWGSLLIMLFGVGLLMLERERTDREQAGSTIILHDCEINNNQDEILASLLEITLDPRANSFGANIDPADLTPFELQVAAAIRRVRVLAAKAPPTVQQRVFQRRLNELHRLVDCRELADAWREGRKLPPVEELDQVLGISSHPSLDHSAELPRRQRGGR
jgi:hypothetical protein